MATLAHITDPNIRRQVARNLQIQAWYMKTVNESTVLDLAEYELKVLHGLYRHEGTPETLSPGSINDLARNGRAISYQVINKRTRQPIVEKTFEVAVFLKNFMPFDKLILEYDSFNPDGSLMGYITIVIPNMLQNFNAVTFKNELETKYNGNLYSAGELVEVTSIPVAEPEPEEEPEGTYPFVHPADSEAYTRLPIWTFDTLENLSDTVYNSRQPFGEPRFASENRPLIFIVRINDRGGQLAIVSTRILAFDVPDWRLSTLDEFEAIGGGVSAEIRALDNIVRLPT